MPSLLVPPHTPRRRWWLALIVPASAVCVHATIVGLVVLSAVFSPARAPKPAKRPVTLRALSARQWAANRGPTARTVPPPDRPEPVPKGQIVDVAPGNNQRPVDSKFIAETNNTVKKETRAKEQTNKWSRATPKNAEKPEQEVASKGVEQPQTEPPKSGIDLSESILGRRLSPPMPVEPSQPVGTADGDAASGSEATTEGGGAPNDALDVPEGDSTALNTREWKYAGFFNRVKQAVSGHWDPNGRLRTRKGLGAATRVTVMHVALRPDGSLADIFVAQSSGLDVLDAEAMMAFQKAAPFPNPPAALVQNGFIRFAFSFQVDDGALTMPRPFQFR